MKKNRNKKRGIRIFAFTLSVCLLSFCLVCGLTVAYVNTNNAIQQQPIKVLEIDQTNFENAELYVFGQKYNIKMENEKPLSPIVYALLPFNIKLIFPCLEYFSDQNNIIS